MIYVRLFSKLDIYYIFLSNYQHYGKILTNNIFGLQVLIFSPY